MASNITSENQLITDAINAHGIFFKKKVREALEKIQGISILGEEYPVSYLEGASLDLLVKYDATFPDYGSYIIPIECKRGYTSVKRWIFFQDPQTDLKFFYILSKDNTRAINADALIARNVPVCMEGVEIDISKTKIQKKNDIPKATASLSNIWNAANQVCRGFLGFLIREVESRAAIKDEANIGVETIAIFPLLITTAPLYICEFSLEAIDILTGNHQGEIKTKEVPWLILKHPFTPSSVYGDTQRYSFFGGGYVTPSARGYNYKEGIMVINSGTLPKFFELISSFRLR